MPIPGTKRVGRLEENTAAADVNLTAAQLAEIQAAADAITMVPNLFDILYYNQEMLIDRPFIERREILTKVSSRYVTPQLVSGKEEEIEDYYHDALDAGHEGVMLKLLDSRYTPGVRGKDWVKIKPEADTLDLVVTGAEWGEGKRAQVFGSFLLSVRSNGRLVPISRVATGFSDEQLNWLFQTLQDDIIREDGRWSILNPGLSLRSVILRSRKVQITRVGMLSGFPGLLK